MNLFSPTKTLSTIKIALTQDKTSMVRTTSSPSVQTILVAFFLDRILNNLNERPREFLLNEYGEVSSGIYEDFTGNPSHRPESELGAYYLGTDYALKNYIPPARANFQARGELLKKGNRIFMQTYFMPKLKPNYESELLAIESMYAFYHYFNNNAAPRIRFIMGSILDHMLTFYDKVGFGVTKIGQVPNQTLRSLIRLEQDKNSDWLKEVYSLFS